MPALPATHALAYKQAKHVFEQIHQQFQLDDDTLIGLVKAFLDEFKRGLENYNQPLAMIPTFVTGVPNGTETGTFLALDLGGTNLRVCEVVLKGDKTFQLRQQKYKVSDALKTGEAVALFDYLADSVDAFLTSRNNAANPPPTPTADDESPPDFLPLGFSAKNAVGHDVVKLLQDAFDRKHMHVKCVALVNDTVGALLSRAYTGGGCLSGAIFGTGTNGAYLEDVAKIKKLGKSPAAARGGGMVVNCEWGAFNNSRSHLPSTPYDYAVDRNSINVGFQAFEKFISGMYLGEIARLLLISLLDAAPRPLIFAGKSTAVINKQWALDTSVLSDVEEAWVEGGAIPDSNSEALAFLTTGEWEDEKLSKEVRERLEKVRGVVVKKLGFKDEEVTLRDAAIVRWASSLVARRAALLSGVAVAAVLVQTGHADLPLPDGTHPPLGTGGVIASSGKKLERISIGVDGSLVEHYPGFEGMLRESLRLLVGGRVEQEVDIGLAKDGSGVGAALCALQALRQD
ncbi:hypothetical protein AX16_009229 [Volvariella volvacea WC 439]|nr:hypothetical protein AX16_009229 [Volvariella volvacea WC 439]